MDAASLFLLGILAWVLFGDLCFWVACRVAKKHDTAFARHLRQLSPPISWYDEKYLQKAAWRKWYGLFAAILGPFALVLIYWVINDPDDPAVKKRSGEN